MNCLLNFTPPAHRRGGPSDDYQVLTFVICAMHVNMTRPLCLEYPGAIHLAIFIDSEDRDSFSAVLADSRPRQGRQELRDEAIRNLR